MYNIHQTYLNQSNIYDTNLFENYLGALNVAPHKISGKYKIVIDTDLNFWLDDYAGRTVSLDINQKFLPQVANFLQTKTQIVDYNKLHYGGFQDANVKKYHIPIYFNNQSHLPKFFVLTKCVDEDIPKDAEYRLHKYSEILNIVSFEKIGFDRIFNEIFSENYFNYPVYFNFAEYKIDIYGYSIDGNQPIVRTIDISPYAANQPYLDTINNLILNSFEKENIFFPKFLNIELEFEYRDDYKPFNNFYGFISDSGPLVDPPIQLDDHSLHAKIQFQDKSKALTFKQESFRNSYTLDKYKNLLDIVSIKPVAHHNAQVKIYCTVIDAFDLWRIYDEMGNFIYEYSIAYEDLRDKTLFESLVSICNKINKITNFDFVFVPKNEYTHCTITVISNILQPLDELYCVEFIGQTYKTIDRFDNDPRANYFSHIDEYDVLFPGSIIDLLSDEYLFNVDGIDYTTVYKFKYNNNIILRFDKPINLQYVSYAQLFKLYDEEIYQLHPISYFNYESVVTSQKFFSIEQYIDALKDKFLPIVEDPLKYELLLEDFREHSKEDLTYQYVDEDYSINELSDIPSVIKNNDHGLNQSIVKNMLLTHGNTVYMTPHVMNFDKSFYSQNGCINFQQLDMDMMRYGWFLLCGEMPPYMSGSILELRYFDIFDYPKITSQIHKVSENYAECIFLGVKYQFPVLYDTYNFAVCIKYNDKDNPNIKYYIEFDIERKLILLSINKYIDFNDLIRGGNDLNTPLLDPSFFYNITKTYSDSSDLIYNFKEISIILKPEFEQGEFVLFDEVNRVYDWKYYDAITGKWYICLFRNTFSSTHFVQDFREVFLEPGDYTLYVYAQIEFEGKLYDYITTIIILKNIVEINGDYLWCEDIEFKFFDTKEIFLNRYSYLLDSEEILFIEKDKIIDYMPLTDNIFGSFEQQIRVIINFNEERFQVLLPKEEISLKRYYFEINQLVTENTLGEKTFTKNTFHFPEFFRTMTSQDIYDQWEDDQDESIYRNRITLFDRNQVFRFMRDLLKESTRIKFLTEQQIRKIMNEFTVSNLSDYTLNNSIQIKGTDEYIKIVIPPLENNIVIWNIFDINKLNLIYRYRGCYYPYFELYNSEYDFQLDKFKLNESFFNIYDDNFGKFKGLPSGIRATSIYDEVQGNIVSSLYCKQEDIKFKISYPREFNYFDYLTKTIPIEECLIDGNKNFDYISQIDANVNKHILSSYVKFILDNFYYLDKVENELEQEIPYTIDDKNQYNLKFQDKNSFTSYFNFLIFIFKRK